MWGGRGRGRERGLWSRLFFFSCLLFIFFFFFFLYHCFFKEGRKQKWTRPPVTAEGHFDGSEAFGVINVIMDLYEYLIWRGYVCILNPYYFCDTFFFVCFLPWSCKRLVPL